MFFNRNFNRRGPEHFDICPCQLYPTPIFDPSFSPINPNNCICSDNQVLQ